MHLLDKFIIEINELELYLTKKDIYLPPAVTHI